MGREGSGKLYIVWVGEASNAQVPFTTTPNSIPLFVCLLLDGRYLSVAFWLLLVLSYLVTNLAFSLCISLRAKMSTDDITLARVLVSEVLFLTLALLLAILVVIVYTTSVGRSVLEAQVIVYMRLAWHNTHWVNSLVYTITSEWSII